MYLPLGGGVFTMFTEIMIKVGFVAMGFLFTLIENMFFSIAQM